jgi:hypothetical protein
MSLLSADKYNLQSDSRYHPGDCLCVKSQITTLIRVQCENCIDESTVYTKKINEDIGCTCMETEVIHTICNICAKIRDEIDTLHVTLEKVMYVVSTEIKDYVDCREGIAEIEIIAKKLRNLNRKLLENMVVQTQQDV